MTNITCKTCRDYLPDLLLETGRAMPGVTAHLFACSKCNDELHDLRATLSLMDEWTAPEPSVYFDARVHARLREDAGQESLWQRLTGFLHLGAGLGLRPAMAGALGVAMLLGGGTVFTVLTHHASAPVISSPTVNDLKIFDNNAQALQQMDLLDEAGSTNAEPPS